MFNISAAYTKSQLNDLGAEWRTFMQLGNNITLSTDFYQPLDADQEYYLDPFLSYQQYNLNLGREGDEDVLGLRVRQFRAGLEMGRNLGHWGRMSLGLFYSGGSNARRHGVPNGFEGDFNNSGFALRLEADTLDSLDFPSKGNYANLRYQGALTALSADEDFQTLLFDGVKPLAWGKSVLIPRIHLGATLSGEPGPEELFLLGGFLDLSGYQPGDISGKYVGLAELIYLYRLNDASAAFSLPLYVGGSLEAGGGWESLDNFQSDSIIPAGSLFLGADTPLGPAYLGAGFSDKQSALYLMLGKLLW
jgi:NTE family protein